MFDTDVFICGGGPAGLAAAIAVRQQGLTATVADCLRPPIDKACGEGLMPDSLEALEALGVRVGDEVSSPFYGIRFIDKQHTAEAHFPKGAGRGVRRTVLHAALHARAEALGTDFLWGERVHSASDGQIRVGDRRLRARWTVAADGLNSAVRTAAGLGPGRRLSRRVGLRQHYRLRPWTPFVEIHWSGAGQAYVTPVAPDEVSVVFMLKRPRAALAEAIGLFPTLAPRLEGVALAGSQRGSLTLGQRYARVTQGTTALLGDASGSVDAIVGEGLGLAFLQAAALGPALRDGNLQAYEEAHRRIRSTPLFLSRAMLLLDRFDLLRRHSIAAFERDPSLLFRMLSVHVGATPLRITGAGGVLHLGVDLLRA